MATAAYFLDRFPEFEEVDPLKVAMVLEDAALIMSSKPKWIEFYDVAHAYHAAHLLVVGLATEDGDSGVLSPIKHQEVDDVVIKNAVGDIKPTFDDMHSTSYGKRYISYRRRCFVGIVGV